MNNIVFSKKGLTLLEAMVVLGLTTIVLAFGISGVASFRRSVELKNGYSNLVTSIRDVQNRAKNSIRDSSNDLDFVPDLYAVEITDNDYRILYCYRAAGLGDTTCDVNDENLKLDRYNYIDVDVSCLDDGSSLVEGNVIAFERLTTNILLLTNTAGNSYTEQDSGECLIEVRHVDISNRLRQIDVLLTENTISYD